MTSLWVPELVEVPCTEVVALELEPSPQDRRCTQGKVLFLGAAAPAFAPAARAGPTAAVGNAHVAAEMWVKGFIYLAAFSHL